MLQRGRRCQTLLGLEITSTPAESIAASRAARTKVHAIASRPGYHTRPTAWPTSTTVRAASSFCLLLRSLTQAACAVRFHDVFEAVYSAPALQNLPFRVTSGNHDHHGNVSAQIAYTNLSSRWYYPDWFYSWKRSYTDKASGNVVTVEVAMIDTVILTAAFELNDTVVGPPPEAQWAWLEGVLDNSSADYLWVGGQ